MSQFFAYLLIGFGISLVLLGMSMDGNALSPRMAWAALLATIGVLRLSDWLPRQTRHWMAERRLRRAQNQTSEFAAQWTPMLFGEYTPYVLEAADKLGEERDMTAVPALMRALELCVDTQPPGWRDRAESLANALAVIGDRRALPLLYRLENVRGIGLIPSIRHAITLIEPQTSLLRPGSADALPETLLRPAQTMRDEAETALLLRAVESEER